MTILSRLEKPGMTFTLCGMISPEWFEGLDNGKIATAQGGLTEGQIMWLALHREQQAARAVAADAESTPAVETEPAGLTPRAVRRRSTARRPARFDLEDTGEL